MTWREILARADMWRARRELDAQLAEDLEAHIQLLARDLVQEGMTHDDALRMARQRVGNPTGLREQSRDFWGFPAVEAVLQDVRYAWRGLRRAPGFATTVILMLALGIGANAAIFSVIDQVMFRPFPMLRAPNDVNRVYLGATYQGIASTNTVFPWRRYVDLQTASQVGTFGAQANFRFAVGTGEAARPRNVVGLTASMIGFFDAPPVRGRWFTAAEDTSPEGALVAVLGYSMWENAFASADVVGQHLKIGTLDYTIIGVAPKDFVAAVPGVAPDIFVPITTIPANNGPSSLRSYTADYSWDWVEVFVRRNAGVSETAASSALTAAYRRSRASAREINPRVLPDSIAHPRAIAGPVKQAAGPDAGLQSLVLRWVTGVAAIVLIIACANVANLMFARVLRRRREVGVRLALGARRSRLVTQFLVEGLMLSLLGCVAGLFVAQWGGAAIRSWLLTGNEPFNLARDWRTIAVAATCAIAAALLTTIGPALMATQTDLVTSLKSGVREGAHQRSRMRTALVVVQGALSVVLLVGASLFVRSFENARGIPLGYDVHQVLEVIPDFRGLTLDSATMVATRERLLSTVRALPGVAAAARVNSRLFGTNTLDLRVDGVDSIGTLGRFNMQVASPDYFKVMSIRMLRGRALSENDRDGAPQVTVVSEAMARALWPGKDALGQCIRVSGGGLPPFEQAPCITVVGIAENTAQQNITDDPRFMYYMPIAQHWPHAISMIYVRMQTTNPRTEMERVRRELARAMPGDGFVVVRPLQEAVDNQSRSWRMGAALFVAFGVLAFIVALIGLYGVISYDVAQRSHELGVRIALGAQARDVVRLVLRYGMRLTVFGLIGGLMIAWSAAPWVQPMLFKLSARDLVTYASVTAVMAVAALVACVVPAMRAQRADPNVALRSD